MVLFPPFFRAIHRYVERFSMHFGNEFATEMLQFCSKTHQFCIKIKLEVSLIFTTHYKIFKNLSFRNRLLAKSYTRNVLWQHTF